LSNCPRVVHKASRVRAAALRSSVLSLAKKRSIGLMGSHRGQDRDGAQIGRVEPAPDLIRERQVEEAGSGGEDGLAPAFHLVGGEIVEDHHVTGPELGDQNLLALQAKTEPVMAPSTTTGGTMPVLRSPATKVVVRQWPCGAVSTSRSLPGPNRSR
jgi:hypothetical protein